MLHLVFGLIKAGIIHACDVRIIFFIEAASFHLVRLICLPDVVASVILVGILAFLDFAFAHLDQLGLLSGLLLGLTHGRAFDSLVLGRV